VEVYTSYRFRLDRGEAAGRGVALGLGFAFGRASETRLAGAAW